MWLMTKYGFYSVVQHRDRPDRYLIRARDKRHLETLLDAFSGQLNGPTITELTQADYRYRIEVDRSIAAEVFSRLFQSIDYPNFKDAVAKTQGHSTYTDFLLNVWSLGRDTL
jgi:hypothetical protein